MLKTRLIPVVLFGGYQLVKSRRFEEQRTVGNPVQIVRMFNEREVDELVFLDIMATRKSEKIAAPVIARVAAECTMPLTVGGGIRTLQDIEGLLKIGADKVSLNSICLEDPSFIDDAAKVFGRQAVVVSVDVRRVGDHHEVFSHCGVRATGREAAAWCREAADRGAGEIMVTSIDHEGMQEGYDLDLVRRMAEAVPVPLLANGGAGSPLHVVSCVKAGASGVCASSIFFFTQYSPRALKADMREAGIDVRL